MGRWGLVGACAAVLTLVTACSDGQEVAGVESVDAASATATIADTGESETDEPEVVEVVDLEGMTLEEAKDSLESSGLEAAAEGEGVADPALEGTVIAQSPAPGDEVDAGSEVTITIARYTGPDIIDGPVTADSSGVDWDSMLTEPPGSLPGMIEAFNGRGDDLIDFSARGTAVVEAHHRGSSNFIVRAIFDDGSDTGVVNEIGRYTGEVVASSPQSSEVVGLEVRADGPWAIIVSNLLLSGDGADLARQYEGVGDAVVGFPMLHSDDPEPVTMFDRARITHEGGANFIVHELLGPGLVNEIGSYEGTVRLSPGGLFGFEVTADGRWTISLE